MTPARGRRFHGPATCREDTSGPVRRAPDANRLPRSQGGDDQPTGRKAPGRRGMARRRYDVSSRPVCDGLQSTEPSRYRGRKTDCLFVAKAMCGRRPPPFAPAPGAEPPARPARITWAAAKWSWPVGACCGSIGQSSIGGVQGRCPSWPAANSPRDIFGQKKSGPGESGGAVCAARPAEGQVRSSGSTSSGIFW